MLIYLKDNNKKQLIFIFNSLYYSTYIKVF